MIAEKNLTCPSTLAIERAERDRKWFMALGILSFILGVLALSIPVATTIASVFFLGSLLFISGVFQIFRSFQTTKGKEFVLHLVIGIFYFSVGVIMILNPGISAVSLSLLIASFFVIGGILRIARAVGSRFHHWGWVFFNGLVSLALGLLIWAGWPLSGFWVIGLFVGIEMIVFGMSMIMLASAGREELRGIREYCEGSPA